MIKSLLDADENPPPNTRVVIEETIVEQPTVNTANTLFSPEQTADAEDILGIPPSANRANVFGEVAVNESIDAPQTNGEPTAETNFQVVGETFRSEESNLVSPSIDDKTARANEKPTIFQAEYEPESTAETMRKSGLAYAAAITLFGAVVFMMVLGWGADLLFGSSPWGIVGGIVLGAVIGFVQLFRLSSQIIKNK